MNTTNNVEVNYLYSMMLQAQTAVGWTDSGAFFKYSMSVSNLIALCFCAGIFVGGGICFVLYISAKQGLNNYKRELEKTSISSAASTSRVEVLEAKIKTLEKAFSSVVDERTKLEVQIKDLNAEIETLNRKK